MVECTALEMRRTGNRIGGSNPSLSASLLSNAISELNRVVRAGCRGASLQETPVPVVMHVIALPRSLPVFSPRLCTLIGQHTLGDLIRRPKIVEGFETGSPPEIGIKTDWSAGVVQNAAPATVT